MGRNLVLLDYDLTVMDNMIDFYEAFSESLKRFGYEPVSYDIFVKHVLADSLHDLLPPEIRPLEFWTYFRRIYPSKSGYPMRGVKRFLVVLKSLNIPVVVISGRDSHPLLLWHELARFGLDDYIDEIYTVFDLRMHGGIEEELFDKSWLIRIVIKKYYVEPSHAIYIGDYKQDYISCSKAGIRFIGITRYRERAETLRKLGAEIIVSDFDELFCYLDRIIRF